MAPTTPPRPSTTSAAPPPQTPARRRKDPVSSRLQGIKLSLPAHLSVDSIRYELIKALNLKFQPEDWQTHTIHHVLKGYDSIVLAGTGYGKSLLFEGLSIMANLKLKKLRKLVIVICPLKALERDQAEQAKAKGINTLVINEDTVRTADLWKEARTTAEMVYLSPEMAQSESFEKLWKDSGFRKRLVAVIVDEAHCVDEWGEDEFRPLYRKLHSLRVYTGMEIPFVACTATCQKSTFDMIWSTLGYGSRPFWGVDVGCDRPNLFFQVREQKYPSQPIFDILNFLPPTLDSRLKREDIDKGLFYMDSEAGTRNLVDAIRKVLPSHLRDCVQAFSSTSSEEAKETIWKNFMSGHIRLLVATDAAGMGCNIPDVKFSVIIGMPKSFSVVAQRWGRAGRDRLTLGVCILLVPKWAFEPDRAPAALALRELRGDKDEPKSFAAKRANVEPTLLRFINSGLKKRCCHDFLRKSFRPETGITTRHHIFNATATQAEIRHSSSPYETTWVQLDLNRVPPLRRCCFVCNQDVAEVYQAATISDERLTAYAHDFLYPLVIPSPEDSPAPSRRNSVTSEAGSDIGPEGMYMALDIGKPSDEAIQALRVRLEQWRDRRHASAGASKFITKSVHRI